MSELAERLIAENLETKAPYLDLGNCGLNGTEKELYKPLKNTDHLETLVFSNRWKEFDEEKEYWENKKSKNKGSIFSKHCHDLTEMSERYLLFCIKNDSTFCRFFLT